MKLFGFDISFTKPVDSSPKTEPVSLRDEIPEIKVSLPDTKKPALIPHVKDPTLNYNSIRSQGRGAFYPAEYDLAEIGRIEDSIAGHRCTVIKNSDETIEVLTFEELYTRFAHLAQTTDKDRVSNPSVMALTWENNQPSWKPILQIIRHKVNKPGFTVYQKTGFTTVTADHSLIKAESYEEITPYQLWEQQDKIAQLSGSIPRYINNNNLIDIAPYLINNNLITINDSSISYRYQGTGIRKNIVKELSIPRFLNRKSLFVILGAYLSEGSVTLNKNSNSYRGFMIHNQNKNWLKTIQKEFNALFGDISKIKTYGDMSRLICDRVLISTLFANMAGYQSENKKIPSFVYNSTSEDISILIKYLVDGDGHREKYGWEYTSKSIKLISGYSTLLRCLGINHSFNYRNNHGRTYYSVRTALHFLKEKTKTSIENCHFNNEYVYDLEVQDTHMFVDAAGQILLHNTDSFVRQAFNKKVALLLKEGWDFIGPNLRTIKYVKARLNQIAAASKIPTEQLLRSVAEGLVKKGNCFLIKVRKTDASGGRERSEPGKSATLKPVAAYFIAPAETMEFEVAGTQVNKWRQCMPDGSIQEYSPKDVIHIFSDRKEGFVFGTPTLIPVVDDIRALRKIEENIELLIYQHLFPLFQYKVGTDQFPAGMTETGEREIDIVKREIMYMPSEGGIVTPHTHEVRAIGAEGRALRAESYLEHFKKRVFSGLGLSAVDFGEGDTSNKSTADNMSRNLVDSVKDLQRVLEVAFNEFVVKELLLESTFGEDVLDEDNLVRLKFKEIDTNDKIKKEAHAADLFSKDIVTHDEARRTLGLEPLKLPSAEEVQSEQDLAVTYPEWARTRWKLFEEPKLLIQALDEPYTAASIAVAKNNATSISQGDLEQANEKTNEQNERDKEHELDLEKERTKIKKTAAKKKDGMLTQTFEQVKLDIVNRTVIKQQFEHHWINSLIRTQMQSTIDKLSAQVLISFKEGYSIWSPINSNEFIHSMSSVRSSLKERINFYVQKLTENLISALNRNIEKYSNPAELANVVRATFDSVEYRTSYIEETELKKARSLGESYGARVAGLKELTSLSNNKEKACGICKSKHNKPIDLLLITLEDLPPHHPGCECRYGLVSTQEVARSSEDDKLK